jgi:hypothetical protein
MGFLQDDYWNLKRLFWEGRVQGSGGVIDGVRAEGENRAVEEVKQRHLSVNFSLSLFVSEEKWEIQSDRRREKFGTEEDEQAIHGNTTRSWAWLKQR